MSNTEQNDATGMKKYAKYSGIAFQMVAIIGVMAALGWWLDGYFEMEKPYLTALCSLIGVISGLYIVIKEVTS